MPYANSICKYNVGFDVHVTGAANHMQAQTKQTSVQLEEAWHWLAHLNIFITEEALCRDITTVKRSVNICDDEQLQGQMREATCSTAVVY